MLLALRYKLLSQNKEGNWNWNPSSWDEVPALAVSANGNFDQQGMNINMQPTLTPTGTHTSLPIGPTVDWDVDFGNDGIMNIDGKGRGKKKIDKRQFEIGPIGVGLTIEFGYPDFAGFETSGFGISFGFVGDINELSFYITEKSSRDAISFAFTPEIFYVHGLNKNVYNSDLTGFGNSAGLGLGIGGFEFGTDGRDGYAPSYYMFSLTGLGRGIDYGYGRWNTSTNVYTIFEMK